MEEERTCSIALRASVEVYLSKQVYDTKDSTSREEPSDDVGISLPENVTTGSLPYPSSQG